MAYDISFFVITGIMLLNTVVALIVDSFSAQRRAAEEREINKESQTFISCLDRKIIEAIAQAVGISDGFNYHEEHKQPKWDYMSFVFYLHEKDPQDFTGPESAIKYCLERKDIKWMPLGRSKLLEEDKNNVNDDILKRIEQQAGNVGRELEGGTEVKQLVLASMKVLSRQVDTRCDQFSEQVVASHQRAHTTKTNSAPLSLDTVNEFMRSTDCPD